MRVLFLPFWGFRAVTARIVEKQTQNNMASQFFFGKSNAKKEQMQKGSARFLLERKGRVRRADYRKISLGTDTTNCFVW